MNILRQARRAAAALLAAGMVTGATVGLSPATAVASTTFVTPATWAYTDSLEPDRSFVDGAGDAPVGAWHGETDPSSRPHISKSYFTFDLPALGGARIRSAEVNVFETAGGDCTRPRATELWLTDTEERPTWANQPKEHVALPGPGGAPTCPGWIGWDATRVIQDALAAGQTRVTLALRVTEDEQADPAFGRHYANDPSIVIDYNFPPDTPTDLMFDNDPCADNQFQPRGFEPRMFATVTDPDGGLVAARFAIWPVDQPADRDEVTTTESSSGSRFAIAAPPLDDNRTYEWTVRGVDPDGDLSAWAPSCRFTTDFTAPAAAPAVSSADYPDDGEPHGAQGVPGQFTFTANGVADVAGFRYGPSEFNTTFVAADALGGSATVTIVPARSGRNDLYVISVDRAGNLSSPRLYQFWVTVTEPQVTSEPWNGGNGVPREFTFTPRMLDVTSYVYRFNNGPETTIAAAGDGTGRVTLTPDRPFENQLTVRSVTSTGVVSGTARYKFRIEGGTPPRVDSETYPQGESSGGPGVPGTFTFTPNMPDVHEYVYIINDGVDNVVAAAPDGAASVTITPTQAGHVTLVVFSRSTDGTVSNRQFYDFDVDQ